MSAASIVSRTSGSVMVSSTVPFLGSRRGFQTALEQPILERMFDADKNPGDSRMSAPRSSAIRVVHALEKSLWTSSNG